MQRLAMVVLLVQIVEVAAAVEAAQSSAQSLRAARAPHAITRQHFLPPQERARLALTALFMSSMSHKEL